MAWSGPGPGDAAVGEASWADRGEAEETGPGVKRPAQSGEAGRSDAPAKRAGPAGSVDGGVTALCSRGRPEPIGACTGDEKSSKKARSVAHGSALVLSAKGKVCSSNTTCREIMTLLVTGSKHRYPLCSVGYPRNTHMVERGESLCGVVADRLG